MPSSRLLVLTYCISLTKHVNRQASYNNTRAILRLLRGGAGAGGSVEPSITLLPASVTLVPHVVELALLILRTTVVVTLGHNSTTANTLSGHILTTTFLRMASARGLVCNESLSCIAALCTSPRHQRILLPYDRFDFRTVDGIFVQDRTLFELIAGSEHLGYREVHVLYRHVYPQGP